MLEGDIKNMLFTNINDDYSFGKYGDFSVVIMRKNEYVNITKLCNEVATKNGNKKEFYRWKTNDNSKILLEEMSSSIGVPKDELLITITDGSKNLIEIRGTYVQSLLTTQIAH